VDFAAASLDTDQLRSNNMTATATIPRLPYTVKQVADMYNMSVESVYAEIRAQRLPAHHKRGATKRWFITDADLHEWINVNLLED
jgi:hypothetical protein